MGVGIITFYCALLVIKGELTLGQMLSIGYISGQLNAPFTQLYEFLKNYQDAKISYERISEVNAREDEDEESKADLVLSKESVKDFRQIRISDLCFSYEKYQTPVIRNLSLTIKRGQVIAFVGNSGSGKTTLVKLLLKFYLPDAGTVEVDDKNLNHIPAKDWRNICGAVLQDGYIFFSQAVPATGTKSGLAWFDVYQREQLNYKNARYLGMPKRAG